MKNLRAILAVLILSVAANAQIGYATAKRIQYGSTLPATCSKATGDVFFKNVAPNLGPYFCSATNTWTQLSSGGAQVIPTGTGFTHITGGAQDAIARAVVLSSADVSGNLPIANLNGGLLADNTHFWRGDGTWAIPAGGGGGGTPGGANTSIQFNDGGVFNGFGTWDGSTMTVPGSLISSAAVGANGSSELGLSSGTTPSWVWAHSGDAVSNAEGGYLKASASPGDTYSSFLTPCSSAGHWCMSSAVLGADSASYIPSLSDIQSQTGVYYQDTGAADAYVITASPAIGSYVAGQRFVFKAVAANVTTTPTLAVNGLAAKTITKNSAAVLAANDIKAGQVVVVIYDGTQFQMQSQVGNPAATVAGADTQVIFNDTGAFAGNANFTFNKTTGVLSLLGGSGSPSIVCGSGVATVPCSLEGDSGDAASNGEPAYLKLGTSPGNTRFNYFYPCSAAGRFAFSSGVPAADCVGTLADFAAQISDAQKQLGVYYADSGAADAYVITPNPQLAAYAAGNRFVFKATNANATTTPTVAVSGLAAKTITKNGTAPLVAGDIKANQLVEVQYDGTQFEMISPVGNPAGTLDKQDVIAGAAGDGTDKTIYTYSMPSGTLPAGKCVRVTAWGQRTAGAGTPTYKLFFGATAVVTGPVVSPSTEARMTATVCNNAGSTTAQWASGEEADNAGFNPTATTPAENTGSGSIVIKGTFNISAATSVGGKGWIVELLP